MKQQDTSTENTYTERHLSHILALQLVNVVITAAAEQGLQVCTAVVDCAGRTRAYLAMDGSPYIAQTMCVQKAKAALMGMPTSDLAAALASSEVPLLSFATDSELSLMGGGLPVVIEGKLVGAIGVGGASVEQDIALAEKALACV